MWDKLSLQERQQWIRFFVQQGIRDLNAMRQSYQDYLNYFSKMEDVAKTNWKDWGYSSEDEALIDQMNQNGYDYFNYFKNDPEQNTDASKHWPDTYKTAYHPTFSDESMYSGVVDPNYNPEGRIGGYWDDNGEFVPANWQDKKQEGGPIREFLRNYVKVKTSRNYEDRANASEKAMLAAWKSSGVATDRIMRSGEYDAIQEAGPLQNSYLLSRKDQDRYMKEHGYMKGTDGDYGLVKSAVGKRNIPVYQTYPDSNDIRYENLVPVGWWYNQDQYYPIPEKSRLQHAGSYPSQFYVDGITGDYFVKSWDLNDYGGDSGYGKRYSRDTARYTDLLDAIGSPAVQTTGFQKIGNIRNPFDISPVTEKFLNGQNGLYFERNVGWTLPQVDIISNEYKSGGGIHIKKSHQGRLTKLKQRTGKTEAELWRTGSPAVRKMITFARNSRKWKHDDGGQIIWDQNGQWSHPGQITGIIGTSNGTDITMKGVADYLYGIDENGNTAFMAPNKEYHFPGRYVVEYPVRYQYGGLMDDSKFTDYSTKAYVSGMKSGLSNPKAFNAKNKVLDVIEPAIQSMYARHPENVAYLPKIATDYLDMIAQPQVQELIEDPNRHRNRQMYMESGGNPRAKSGAGAMGLFQIMPGTLQWYQDTTKDIGDVYDPVYNERVRDWVIDRIGKSKWVSQEGIDENERLRRTMAAYNWGTGNLNKAMNKYGDAWLEHVPTETRNYVNFIVDGLDAGKYKTNAGYDEFIADGNPYIRQYGGIIRPFSYIPIPVVRY